MRKYRLKEKDDGQWYLQIRILPFIWMTCTRPTVSDNLMKRPLVFSNFNEGHCHYLKYLKEYPKKKTEIIYLP